MSVANPEATYKIAERDKKEWEQSVAADVGNLVAELKNKRSSLFRVSTVFHLVDIFLKP